MSLALAHKRRTIALGGAAITAAAVSGALPYSPAEALSSPANARKHLLLQEAALDQDLARISAINGLAGRQALKRDELLPKYQEYVQRYCESGCWKAMHLVMSGCCAPACCWWDRGTV